MDALRSVLHQKILAAKRKKLEYYASSIMSDEAYDEELGESLTAETINNIMARTKVWQPDGDLEIYFYNGWPRMASTVKPDAIIDRSLVPEVVIVNWPTYFGDELWRRILNVMTVAGAEMLAGKYRP